MLIITIIRRLNASAAHAEHVGLACYATAESLGVHHLVAACSVWLCVWGLWVVVRDDLPSLIGKAR